MSAIALFEEIKSQGWSALEAWEANHIAESLHLEFKTCESTTPGKLSDGDRARLAKAVAGFANVDGGLYVLGVDARPNKKCRSDCVVGLAPVEGLGEITRDVKESCRRLVQPTIPGLDVHAVPLAHGVDRGAVVVIVPPSDVGPHRVTGTSQPGFDDRYYMRVTSDTVAIPHSVLATMFGRVPAPQLKLRVFCRPGNRVEAFVENHGRGVARDIFVRAEFMKNEHNELHASDVQPGGSLWYRREQRRPDGRVPLGFRKNPQEPLFPGDAEPVFSATLARTPLATDFMRVRLDAELAPPVVCQGPVPMVDSDVLLPDDVVAR